LVDAELLFLVGSKAPVQEQELGPQEADAIGALLHGLGGVGEGASVGRHIHAPAVQGDGGQVRLGLRTVTALQPKLLRLHGVRERLGSGVDGESSIVPIEDEEGTVRQGQ